MAISVEHFSRIYPAASSRRGASSPGRPSGASALSSTLSLSEGLKAVDDLSFEVGPGEIVGLIGPNGAGKTTTLRALAGILRPTAGTVAIDGHDIVSDAL